MKAKLIKTDKGNYVLTDPTKGTYDKGYMLGSSRECDLPKLSLKNCQAIELGYDLDELAIECMKNTINQETGGDNHKLSLMLGFQKGFQKALDLNNTKLYTLEDMMNCWNKALTFQDHKELFGYHIQSIQQTEWDVEIEKENVMHDYNGNISLGAKFKLDPDGCLILKRID